MHSALALAAMLVFAPLAHAEDFACRSEPVQFHCRAGICTIPPSDEVTPMAASRTGATLSVCAGEGCYEGRITTRRSRGDVDFLYAIVTDAQNPGATKAEAALLYNRRTRSAQLSFAGFANTMGCAAD